MRPRTLRKRVAAACAGIILAGTGVGWAAKADANDDQLIYLQLLNLRGITVHNTAAALQTGYVICDALNYATGDVVAYELWRATSWAEIPTISMAGDVVVSAVEGLCPWHDHRGVRA